MPDLTLRNSRSNDERNILQLIEEAFPGFEYLPRIRQGLAGGYLNSEGSFIAEETGNIAGSISCISLPRSGWFETRFLAVRKNDQATANKLIGKVEDYARSKHGERLKVLVPGVEPYVSYYKDRGFVPTRHDLRIVWDLKRMPSESSRDRSDIRNVTVDMADMTMQVWMNGMKPYWDWWFEERGGPENASSWVKDSVKEGDPWIGVFEKDRMIGTTIVWPDNYGPGQGRFNGVFVLPEYRSNGLGSRLLHAVIAKAIEHGQESMRVYTMSYLDHLAPGAAMYLKNNGKIEAEYLRLEKKLQ